MRLPGFESLRVLARFAMLAVLCQSMLLALAVARWPSRWTRPAAMAAVGLALLVDGWARVPLVDVPVGGPVWADVPAVVELPLGEPAESGALFRAMEHRRGLVNGYSGYNAPHYLPLVYALRDGQFSALFEVAAGRPLGVAVKRSAANAPAIETALGSIVGVTREPAQKDWAMFTVYLPTPAPPPQGREIAVVALQTNRHHEDVGRLSDHRVDTAWASGASQIGDEELVLDLGSTQSIGGVGFDMGAFSFGFPRALEVDVSSDRIDWHGVWGGRPSVLVVRAAVADPGAVPVMIGLGQVRGRFLRLRQTGSEPGIPWWIAELHVLAPPETPAR